MHKQTAPYRPGHGGYVSEFTIFMEDFIDTHPAVRESRRQGWDIFWDHRVDFQERDLAASDAVPATPYYYK